MAALPGIDAGLAVAPLAGVLDEAASRPRAREQAANALAKINQDASRAALLKALPTAPGTPPTGDRHRPGGQPAGGRRAAQGRRRRQGVGPAAPGEGRRPAGSQEAKLPDLEARLATLLNGLPPADQKLNELIDRRTGRVRRGEGPTPRGGPQVFEKNCAACHQIGGKGARIGPQLDGVGLRGLDRLMEDILDPNRNVDQAFRTTLLALDDGQVASGLLLKEEGDVLVLADAQGKEVRVPKGKVEDRKTSQLSPMPANFGDQIPEADFADLLAFLLAQRP